MCNMKMGLVLHEGVVNVASRRVEEAKQRVGAAFGKDCFKIAVPSEAVIWVGCTEVLIIHHT